MKKGSTVGSQRLDLSLKPLSFCGESSSSTETTALFIDRLRRNPLHTARFDTPSYVPQPN